MAITRLARLAAAVFGTVAAVAAPALAQNDQEARPQEPLAVGAPVVACFAPGTDPAYVARVEWFVELRNQAFFGPDYYINGSWSSVGTPRNLTWSFVPDGLSIPNGVGEPAAPSTLFSTMDSGFASQGGRATWINRFQQTFDRWAALSGLSYTRIRFNNQDWDDGAVWGSAGSANNRGDIRISMKPIDGGSGILAYNSFPTSGDMVLDSGDIGLYASSSNANRFLRNVVAHEHGHGMGLLHVCTGNSNILMEPFIDTSYDGPRQDDIRGAQRSYGDDYATNNTSASATQLGALVVGTPINLGAQPNPVSGTSDPNASTLSIDGSGRSDWFSFTFSQALTLTVTATPVGSTYNMAQQTNPCGSGTPFNALATGNLVVDVYDSNGTTLLGTSNTTAAGVPEVLQVGLNGSGTRLIRISANPQPSSTQLYRLTVSGSSPCPSFTQHPQNVSQCEGQAVLLSVAVTGSPTPTLQWRKNQQDIPGATSANYVISQATPEASGIYDCVATNSCSSVTSNPATVTIGGEPIITQQPQSQNVAVGAPVTFSITVSPLTPVNYQWRKDGATIPLANNSTYQIAAADPQDEGVYDVLLFGNCGNGVSAPATLTVGGPAPCYANCDGSTTAPILNVNDFICFQTKFAANDPYANCDGSTTAPILNVNDFICFQTRFAQGCP